MAGGGLAELLNPVEACVRCAMSGYSRSDSVVAEPVDGCVVSALELNGDHSTADVQNALSTLRAVRRGG